MSVDDTNPGFYDGIAEDAVLESLGYQQALGGVLIVGIESGGPPVMVWSWIAVCLVTLAVAYSFAEMCSAYPVAGGQYSWVAVLAPPRYARGLSWVTGWFMITGIVSMGSVNNFIGANFLLGMANLSHPSFVIQRWHTVLLTYLITILAASFNIFYPHLLNRISKGILVWNVASFIVVIASILATNDHKQSASFVFRDFQNQTGFNAAMGTIVGLLQSFFGMCCYDAPAHMTEEMKNASKEAPKAIIMSVYLGAITGFVFLISAFFCIGDLQATAESSTGVPLIQIFFDSTGSVAGSCALGSLISVIVLVCANSLLAEGARALYAFSRDSGLPFSRVFSKVDKKRQVPINSILLCGVVQAALNSIYFGNYTAFSTVISIATEGFYLSYAMPLFVRILARFTGHTKVLPGPYTLGRWGIWLNLIGFIFLLFAAITFNFPSVAPVDSENMNYCSAAIGVIGLISLVTWIVDGRKNFTGPETGVVNATVPEGHGLRLGKPESDSDGGQADGITRGLDEKAQKL
ncbi:MAG: hypothetical protein Q9160_006625 [Pyrenula sp. 1 TL-2023]